MASADSDLNATMTPAKKKGKTNPVSKDIDKNFEVCNESTIDEIAAEVRQQHSAAEAGGSKGEDDDKEQEDPEPVVVLSSSALQHVAEQ
ncbi:hypothetical protein EOD39_20920 [Acipenser ruthenus]|uniref:Uncharacterized protein n=1 Tax=Acipenser ruthenus TaxID=7906 RepID=A0A444UU50_ACIRT|nr:hypothetical protein EOD39_20920 [Acipenser ruthenus]